MKKTKYFWTVRAHRHIFQIYSRDLSLLELKEIKILEQEGITFWTNSCRYKCSAKNTGRQCVFQHSEPCDHSARIPQTQTTEFVKLWTPGTSFYPQDKTLHHLPIQQSVNLYNATERERERKKNEGKITVAPNVMNTCFCLPVCVCEMFLRSCCIWRRLWGVWGAFRETMMTCWGVGISIISPWAGPPAVCEVGQKNDTVEGGIAVYHTYMVSRY